MIGPCELSIEAYDQLVRLIPKLAGATDKRRLKVLSDIDRVLAAERQTWEDIAEALRQPALSKANVLTMVERIEQHPTESLTDRARIFVSQVRERAERNPERIYLSRAQYDWLWSLYDHASREPQAVLP